MFDNEYDNLYGLSCEMEDMHNLYDLLLHRTDDRLNWDDKSKVMKDKIFGFIYEYYITRSLIWAIREKMLCIEKYIAERMKELETNSDKEAA